MEAVYIYKLQGRPAPPTRLFDGDKNLTGEDARTFFTKPPVLEVFLTQTLSPQELGVYFFHIGEMQTLQVTEDITYLGHRNESTGTVLRFQAESSQCRSAKSKHQKFHCYQEILEVLALVF